MHTQAASSQMPITAGHISQVQNELNVFDNGLEHLGRNLKMLRTRLQVALRVQPSSQAPVQQSNAPQPMLVPLADAIRGRNDALSVANHELDDILDALDL